MQIRLQFINGVFMPTDAVSIQRLSDTIRREYIPESLFDRYSPVLVRNGYSLSVAGYNPEPTTVPLRTTTGLCDNTKPVSNPCTKCHLREVCDSDDCGRKLFSLFSRR